MEKHSNESWLHYWGRCIRDLHRDEDDAKYWAGVFGMTGSACLAVAFIEGDSFAMYIGAACCIYGLKFNRKGKNNAQ